MKYVQKAQKKKPNGTIIIEFLLRDPLGGGDSPLKHGTSSYLGGVYQ